MSLLLIVFALANLLLQAFILVSFDTLSLHYYILLQGVLTTSIAKVLLRRIYLSSSLTFLF